MCAAQFHPTLESLESRLLFANVGDLDSLFSGGKVVADLLGTDDYGFALAVQSDGKVLVAGQTDSGGTKGNDFAVVRFNVNGTRDTTFGTNGLVTTDLGSVSDAANAIVVQSDGKIVVVGQTTRSATSDDFAIVRYSASGALDTTFGSGGKVTTDFAASSDQALGVALAGSGQIVVSGWASVGGLPRFAVARYTSMGQLDTSFGSGGKTTSAFAAGYARGQRVVLLPDGSMVVAGAAYDFSADGGDFAAVKYLSNGQIDTSFGSSGWALVDFGADESAHSVMVQSDGKIVLAGEYYDFWNDIGDFALARLNANGSLDTSFGSSGRVTTDFNGEYDQGIAASMQSNGMIVVAGTVTFAGKQEFGLARYTTNGSLDTSFAATGKTEVAFGASDTPNDIAIDGQGRIVVGGFTTNSAGHVDFAVARLIGKINVAPTANPGSGYSVTAGSSKQLDGSGSFDPDGVIVNYQWDFNYDGVNFDVDATGANPTFSAAGLTGPITRTVALRVTDENGASSIATTTVSVLKLIVPPTANPGGTYQVIAGSTVKLDGSGSFDPDGVIVNYQWDFNYDGSTFNADATGATPIFSAAGLTGPTVRTVALRVTDNDGATNVVTATVNVAKLIIPPTASAGGSHTVIAGASIQLDGRASFDTDGAIVNYQWDFDYDGSTFNVDATGATPIFSAAGLTGPIVRTVALRVTDDDGATNVVTATVNVAKFVIPPTANAGGSYTVIAGASIQLDGSASFDTDGVIVNYEWDFNYDGQTFDTNASGAAPTFSAAGLTGPSTRTVALRMTDDDGATSIATATVTIQPVPVDPPSPADNAVISCQDPSNPHCNILVVHGTSGNDRMRFHRTQGGQIEVMLNGAAMGKFSNVSRIVAYGEDGDDVIDARCANLPVEFYGGGGNDRLYGGRFGDILVGGDGNDRLWACGGNDLVVGGMGQDDLHGACGHDLLISGGLANQDDASAMESLLKSWNAPGITKTQRTQLINTLSILNDAAPSLGHGHSIKDFQSALFSCDLHHAGQAAAALGSSLRHH